MPLPSVHIQLYSSAEAWKRFVKNNLYYEEFKAPVQYQIIVQVSHYRPANNHTWDNAYADYPLGYWMVAVQELYRSVFSYVHYYCLMYKFCIVHKVKIK